MDPVRASTTYDQVLRAEIAQALFTGSTSDRRKRLKEHFMIDKHLTTGGVTERRPGGLSVFWL